MRCPFLQEATVRSCGLSPFRKMLPDTGRTPEGEKCHTPDFVSCPLLVDRTECRSTAGICPFLQVSLVHYCSSAPETHFIPYSETLLSCCENDGHRYCELYVDYADPEHEGHTHRGRDGSGGTTSVEGIDLPADLAFSANHMWLDVSEDGSCHVGVDAFLASVVGRVEKVTFVSSGTLSRPTVVLRIDDQDLMLVFPRPMVIGRANVHLRSEPGRLVEDPYGLGWLYEGRLARRSPRATEKDPEMHLYEGPEALSWMKSEAERMTRFIHEYAAMTGPDGTRMMNDGGSFRGPVLPFLEPADRALVFSTFFSLETGRQG